MLRAEDIREAAKEVGLDDCGVARAMRLDEDARLMDEWVAKGLHGKMSYLERNKELRYDPRELVKGARWVVVGLLSFEHSGRDYHRAVKTRLYRLEERLRTIAGEEVASAASQHIFCDSAPFLERRWATKAGLGWIGKNRHFIHPRMGSGVHIGELVLNIDIEAEEERLMDNGCGDCRQCLDACPTGAVRCEEWDARKCTAYETFHCLGCQCVIGK